MEELSLSTPVLYPEAVACLTAAFQEDPVLSYLFEDEEQRPQHGSPRLSWGQKTAGTSSIDADLSLLSAAPHTSHLWLVTGTYTPSSR